MSSRWTRVIAVIGDPTRELVFAHGQDDRRL